MEQLPDAREEAARRQPPRDDAPAEDLLEARGRPVPAVARRGAPQRPQPRSRNTLAALLRGRDDLRRAMLLHVVLGPPRSLDVV